MADTQIDRRQLILNLLKVVPRMTAEQVARAAYPNEGTREINGKLYPKSYQAANNLLVRMGRKEGKSLPLVKRQVFKEFDRADLWMLPETRKLQGNYQHYVKGIDLFTAYLPFIQFYQGRWSHEPTIGESDSRADEGMLLFETEVYFEVDCCTELSPYKINEKLDPYLDYVKVTGKKIHVIFPIVGDDDQEEFDRADFLLKIFARRYHGNMFLVARHKRLMEQPVGAVLRNPKGEMVSLIDVIKEHDNDVIMDIISKHG